MAYQRCYQLEHIAVGVTEGLGIHHLCIGLDGSLKGAEVIDVDNGIANALSGQRVGNQVVGTTIEVVGSDNVVTILHDVLQCIGDGFCSA